MPQKAIELVRLRDYKLGLLTLCAGELLKDFKERYNTIIFVVFKDHYGAMLLIHCRVEVFYICILFLYLGAHFS